MGVWDDISDAISGGSSGGSSSIILPTITIPGIDLPGAPSIPSFGYPPPGYEPPSLVGSIFTSPFWGVGKPGLTLPAAITGQFDSITATFNNLFTSLQQSLMPIWDNITDMGALMELLSNPETIIIIVAVIAAVAIGLYVAYKFYWSKIEFGESVADKYTKRGLEAAKIFK